MLRETHALEQYFGLAMRLVPAPLFSRMCSAANKHGPNPRLVGGDVLAMDPGETTGLAAWDSKNSEILLWQWETKEIGPCFQKLAEVLQKVPLDHLRAEDYKVYGWKANEHSFASLHTPRWLGAIEAAAYISQVPFTVKLAQHAKTFWTDGKLQGCGIYHPGMKHARDACRHLALYMAFGA